MTNVSSFNEIDQKRFVNASAKDILGDQQLLNRFRRKPDLVLDEKLKDIPSENRVVVKAEIKQMVTEVDQVLPGFNRDEGRDILNASLQTARVTFSIFTWLNVALFTVGIGLFVLAAVAGFVNKEEQFSIIFGASGIASLLPFFITNPLKRISNAASDQSQLRTVLFGYWSQMANLRTQILPPVQQPDLATIKDLNSELRKAMEQAIEQLQKYVESKVKEDNPDNEKQIKFLQDRVGVLEKKLGVQSGT
jgi:hypothetical protein